MFLCLFLTSEELGSGLDPLKTLTLSPEKCTPVDPEAAGAVTIQGVAESAMVLLDDGVALCIIQMLRMQRIPIAKTMLAAPNEMLLVPILMIGRSLIVQV